MRELAHLPFTSPSLSQQKEQANLLFSPVLFVMSDDIENQRITIVPTQGPRRGHAGGTALTARRTLSIQAPTVPPSARLPIEFRTLSLHLENSKKPDDRGKESKGTVKGLLHLPYSFPSPQPAGRRTLTSHPLRPYRPV